MKIQKFTPILVLFVLFLISACLTPYSWDMDTGTITISLGDNARSSIPYPPTSAVFPILHHEIILTRVDDPGTTLRYVLVSSYY